MTPTWALLATVFSLDQAATDTAQIREFDPTFQSVNLIPKDGKADPRRWLTRQEKREASGIGYFHIAGDKNAFFGSGFLAKSRKVVISAAHLFVNDKDNGQWRDELRNQDGSLKEGGVEFFSEACGRSYKIKSFDLLTKQPISDRKNDVAIVILEVALCREATPLQTRPLDDDDIKLLRSFKKPSISVPAYQLLKRDGDPGSKGDVAWLTDDGKFDHYVNGQHKRLIYFTASTLPGSSGGPVIGRVGKNREDPAVMAINVSESKDGKLNIAVIIDDQLDDWIQKAADKNP